MKTFIACAVFLGACSSKPAAPPAPKTDPNAKPYTLSVEAPASAKVGAENQFRIVLLPAAGYHINDDGYPFEIDLVTTAAKITKTKYEQADAKVYSKEQARFEIPFTPTQVGPGEYKANVSLAVCRESECIPRKETLSWKTTAAQPGPLREAQGGSR
jgi:hypothetical protein